MGAASDEVLALLTWLRPGSRVLELGGGAGHNALPLARAGMEVTAVDASEAACGELAAQAKQVGAELQIVVQDVTRFVFMGSYDAVIAYGVLHGLPPRERNRVLERMRAHTSFGGANVVAAFTNRFDPPAELVASMPGLFGEGELFELYRDWDITLQRVYTLQCRRDGVVSHERPVNQLVACRPPS